MSPSDPSKCTLYPTPLSLSPLALFWVPTSQDVGNALSFFIKDQPGCPCKSALFLFTHVAFTGTSTLLCLFRVRFFLQRLLPSHDRSGVSADMSAQMTSHVLCHYGLVDVGRQLSSSKRCVGSREHPFVRYSRHAVPPADSSQTGTGFDSIDQTFGCGSIPDRFRDQGTGHASRLRWRSPDSAALRSRQKRLNFY